MPAVSSKNSLKKQFGYDINIRAFENFCMKPGMCRNEYSQV